VKTNKTGRASIPFHSRPGYLPEPYAELILLGNGINIGTYFGRSTVSNSGE